MKSFSIMTCNIFCIYRCDDNDIKNLHTHINGEVGFEPQS
jgi:hypothetical protein